MNRLPVPISKLASRCVAAGLALACLAMPLSAVAQTAHGPELWFLGSRLIVSEARSANGELLLATDDAGLQRFLAKLGAHLSYQPGECYVVVTAADHRSIVFALGSSQYTIDGQPQDAAVPVTNEAEHVLVPFFALARALYVVPVASEHALILQPQIADVETQADGSRTVVLFHGAAVLHPVILSSRPNETVLRFTGTASTLPPERDIASPGLNHMSVAVTGSPRNPTTVVTLLSPQRAHAAFLPTPDLTSAVIALDTNATSSATGSVSSSATNTQSVANAIAVTDLHEQATPDAFTVTISLSGQPNYAWRFLGDGRFYIDIHNASLSTAPRDEMLTDPRVASLRLRENGTESEPNVRLALTLVGGPALSIQSDAKTLTLRFAGQRAADALRAGQGQVGQTVLVQQPIEPVAPAPVPVMSPVGFSRGLIVLDPGHGGSDTGAQHNGLTEKILTLDIARRLRSLLVAQGWSVKMTRDADVDVYAPNDSAREELQARCDIANAAGARYFVSIHINSFTSPDLQGTTTYYYHPQDAAFAAIVEKKLVSALGTQNDGAQKANYYVIHHTTMPAILVETAFLSNSDDAVLLRQSSFRQSVALGIRDGINAYASGTGTSRQTTDDHDDVSVAPPSQRESSRDRSQTFVRSAASMDDDLSQ